MRDIPDFKTEFSQVVDYIMGSDLAKKAFINPPFENYVNIIIETLSAIDRLADNCHMPEFTNHALPHICSVVKRASEWAVNDKWIDAITPKEAGYLLLSLIIHDIGMLSQDPNHLPDSEKINAQKGLSDISTWVRKTHVSRLDKLYRSLVGSLFAKNEHSLNLVILMAASHSIWPWDKNFNISEDLCKEINVNRNSIMALCAVIAVSDLLDEDSNRCDTVTLIKHKQGTIDNIAHWIRHALTVTVSSVDNHTINVNFRKLTNIPDDFEIIYRVLRNHYKLIKAYNSVLKNIRAEITNINFSPSDGIPDYEDQISEELHIWETIDEFKYNLTERIFSTFMPETKGIYFDAETEKNILALGLESVILPESENYLLTLEEDVIQKADNENEIEILNYLYKKAETEYLNGNIGSVRYFCSLAIELIDNSSQKINLSDIYWVFSFVFDCFRKQMDFDSIKKIYGIEYDLPRTVRVKDNTTKNKKININNASYQVLLDFLFNLNEYKFEHNLIINSIELCKEIDVDILNNDLPTAIIFEKIADILFSIDEKSLALDFLEHFIKKIPNKNKSVQQMLKDIEKRLTWHQFVFEHDFFAMPENMNSTEEIFAYTWRNFYDHSWHNLEICLNSLIKQVNSKSPYYISVVGFYNMFSQQISLQNHDDFPILKMSSFQKYQRIESENPRVAYISELCSEVDNLLLEIKKNPTTSAYQRNQIMRYVIHLKSISRKYWDLGLYIEAHRYLTELSYSLSTYKNEQDVYSGLPEWCNSCIINSIKSLDSKLLSDENKKKLIGIMECYKKETFDNIYQYIFEESKEAEWFECVKWLNFLETNIPKKRIKDLIRWSLKFLELSENTKYRFDSKWWNFLTSIVKYYKLSSDEWKKLEPIIDKVLYNPYMASSCYNLYRELLINIPKSLCIKYLKYFANINPDESSVPQQFIATIYNVSLEREDIVEEGKKALEALCKNSNNSYAYYLDNPKVEVRDFDEKEVKEHLKATFKKLTPIKGQCSFYTDLSFYYRNINWSNASEAVLDEIFIMFEEFFEKYQRDIYDNYFKAAFDILTIIALKSPIKYQRRHLSYTLKLIEDDYQTSINVSERIKSSPMQALNLNIENETKHEAFLIALCYFIRIGNEKQNKAILKWLINTLSESNNKNLYYYTYLFGFLYLTSTKINKQLAFVGIMMLKAFCISKSDALYYNLLLNGIHHLFIHSSDNSKDMLKKFYLKSNLEFREFTVWVLLRFYNSTNCDERKSCAELIRELINCKQYTSISEIEDMKKSLLDDSRKSIREILGEE